MIIMIFFAIISDQRFQFWNSNTAVICEQHKYVIWIVYLCIQLGENKFFAASIQTQILCNREDENCRQHIYGSSWTSARTRYRK